MWQREYGQQLQIRIKMQLITTLVLNFSLTLSFSEKRRKSVVPQKILMQTQLPLNETNFFQNRASDTLP